MIYPEELIQSYDSAERENAQLKSYFLSIIDDQTKDLATAQKKAKEALALYRPWQSWRDSRSDSVILPNGDWVKVASSRDADSLREFISQLEKIAMKRFMEGEH